MLKIKTEKEEYPISGDNEKTLEIVDGVFKCKFIPQYLYIVTKYYLVLFGVNIFLYRKSKKKNYFIVKKQK